VLFNSFTFAVFFGLFYGLYWSLARKVRLQNLLILAGSYLFYGWWDERFLVLIIVSSVTDYLAGFGASAGVVDRRQVYKALAFLWTASVLALASNLAESQWIFAWLTGYTALLFITLALVHRQPELRRRRVFVACSVVINLTILGTFKYFNFFATEFTSLFGSLGIAVDPVALNIVLPVGISFYTFQTMSYTLDVYSGKMKSHNSMLDFAAYVAFFPQLVAGPIERARRLLPQFHVQRKFSWESLTSGFWLFAWGLYKKLVIADNLAPIANRIFADPLNHSSAELIAGLLAFTFQIYCDFSGYSDMARGIARTLGFKIMVNFRLPYFSRTPSEFWQGWHISLSSWLRDYLYIPLGGNRSGPIGTYRNLALTMLLGGLWHGAAWTFIAWGAYQGAILVVYRLIRVDVSRSERSREGSMTPLINAALTLLMFCLTMLGWLFFRAASMQDVWIFAQRTFLWTAGSWDGWLHVLAYISPLLAMQVLQKHTGRLELISETKGFIGLTVRAMLIYALVFLSASGGQEFIYFDF
jgi:D-alanyl-lipoteichoic acid acyltransferase DltB (MBOAT superfamily)